MKIAGFCSGHDCSYAILENGIPILHNELERFTRQKEPIGDSIQFMFDTYENYDDIKHFTHCFDTWKGGIKTRYPHSFQKLSDITKKNSGDYFIPGHHQSHAANAFFSSNFDKALIVTIDGGGRDYTPNREMIISCFTVWEGLDNKIHEIEIIPDSELNIGVTWQKCTKEIFGLSVSHPKGNQAGTVMAMACMGNAKKYYEEFYNSKFKAGSNIDLKKLSTIANKSEQDKFDVAAGLQLATEMIVKSKLDFYLNKYPHENLCLSGGVVLNSVLIGKLYDWYPHLKNIYVCPVPYDAGLAIGAAQYVWHHLLNNPRIKWNDNCTPYLGKKYNDHDINTQLKKYSNLNIKYNVPISEILTALANKKIISLFGGSSESGRRALGNRSIIADPRDEIIKKIINDKVKHRQWFRPFAPSILKEEVKNWFEKDINSPYMSTVLTFKKEVQHLVPAVVHYDGTGRLQTVTENDNKWYYNFIKQWFDYSNVPIILNTSFNDQEPIVETPEHAINCFLKTDLDYLYFYDYNILVSKHM